MSTFVAGMAACLLLLMSASGAGAYQAESVSNGGTISGSVKYVGSPPLRQPLEITKDRDVCGTYLVYDQSLLVARDGGIANAVVTLNGISRGEPLKPDPAVKFEQKGCEYVPRIAAFPAGSTIEIINADGILHNIHTISTVNPVIDIAQPGFKKRIDVTVEKPEVIKVTCDAHNWMEGWWYVTANPYYAITDSGGHFIIANVPPGTYRLQVWQERLGVESRNVTVQAGVPATVNFTYQSAGGRSRS